MFAHSLSGAGAALTAGPDAADLRAMIRCHRLGLPMSDVVQERRAGPGAR